MTKRSPILGYNHNVRYRGLVFHVQTEDSGVLSPHLFTHLFHHGVIVSTRKLVYDAGAAEDAIKGLMQAQHKVVLKELKRGSFDDKIDAYLGGTPGLLPRGSQAATAPITEPDVPVEAADATTKNEVPTLELDAIDATPMSADSQPEIEIISDQDVIRLDEHTRPTLDTMPVVERPRPPKPPAMIVPTPPPGAVATVSDGVPQPRPPTAPTPSDARTLPRDAGAAKDVQKKRETGDRPSVVGAALPPPRMITRPPSRPALPAMSAPTVVSRALPPEERRSRETDAVEVYAPAPPSAEPPPGMAASERPGQYAQHNHRKTSSQRIPTLRPDGDRISERIERAAPAERPLERAVITDRPPVDRVVDRPGPIAPSLARANRPPSSPIPTIPLPPSAGAGAGTGPIPKQIARELSPALPSPPPASQPVPVRAESQPIPTVATPRTQTPTRASTGTPVQSRTGTANSGVVMTRPAVIVGAPVGGKPTQPRVRKAREDEGRGFGQGLISEKSLDEVILAYLSEDADEK